MRKDKDRYYRCERKGDDAELVIFDDIGESFWGGVGPDRVHNDLKALGKVDEILVRINSPGGNVFDGFAIYNMLKSNRAGIRVQVEGQALSAASIIAMSGDTIVMHESSWMMIHEAWTITAGNAAELREVADRLDDFSGTGAKIYSDRTGIGRDEVRTMMEEETWMDGERARELGFADEVEENLKVAASLFDPKRHSYSHPPKVVVDKAERDRDEDRDRRARLASMARRAAA